MERSQEGINMKTLIQFYNKDKEKLGENLRNFKNPKESLKIIQDYIYTLTDIKGEYMQGLTLSQARIVLDLLGYFMYICDKVYLNMGESAFIQSEEIKVKEHKDDLFDSKTIVGIGTASIVSSMLTGTLPSIIFGLITGLGASAAIKKINKGNEKTEIIKVADVPPDYKLSLEFLEALLKNIDNLIEHYGSPKDMAQPILEKPKLDDHMKILEFIQDIHGWYMRKKNYIPEDIQEQLKLRMEEHLPNLLSEYDIQIKYYDSTNSNEFHFEKEVGEQKLQSSLNVYPALLKNGEILLMGRVIEPKN